MLLSPLMLFSQTRLDSIRAENKNHLEAEKMLHGLWVKYNYSKQSTLVLMIDTLQNKVVQYDKKKQNDGIGDFAIRDYVYLSWKELNNDLDIGNYNKTNKIIQGEYYFPKQKAKQDFTWYFIKGLTDENRNEIKALKISLSSDDPYYFVNVKKEDIAKWESIGLTKTLGEMMYYIQNNSQ